MKGFQEKGRETQNLEQIYKKLEQDWHAMKQNSYTSRKSLRSYNHYSSDLTEEQGYEYFSNFSRKIMCELQRDEGTNSPQKEEEEEDYYTNVSSDSDDDIEAREGIHERVEAIESAKLICNMPLINLREDDVEIFEDVDSSPLCFEKIRSNFCDSDDEYEKCCPSNCCALSGGYYCSCYPLSVSSSSSYNADVYNEKAVRAVVEMAARVLEMRLASAENRRKRRKMLANIFSWFIGFVFLVISMFVIYGGIGAGEVVLVPT